MSIIDVSLAVKLPCDHPLSNRKGLSIEESIVRLELKWISIVIKALLPNFNGVSNGEHLMINVGRDKVYVRRALILVIHRSTMLS